MHNRTVTGGGMGVWAVAGTEAARIENVLWLCEQGLLELPIVEEEPGNALLNVERREEGYEHASSRLKDVFDAMGLALTEARMGPQRSVDVLSPEGTVDDPRSRGRRRVGWRVVGRRG